MPTRVYRLGWAGLLALAAALPTLPAGAKSAPNVTGASLAGALPTLGDAYHTPLKAGPHVAARRLFLFQEGRDVAAIRAALQRFVPKAPGTARWHKEGPVLVFDEDADAAALRAKAARGYQQAERQKRSGAVAQAQADSAPRAGDDTFTARQRHYRGMLLGIWNGLPKSVQQQALQGRYTQVPLVSLPPDAQAIARRVLGTHSYDGHGVHFFGPRDWQQAVVRLEPNWNGGPHPTFGMVVGTPWSGIGLPDVLNPAQFDKDGHYGWAHVQNEYRDHAYHAASQGLGKRFPELAREVRLVPDEGVARLTVWQCLKELTEQAALPLVGEYDPCLVDPYQPGGSPPLLLDVAKPPCDREPLWKALDRVCRAFDLTWDYRAGWIELRSPRQPAVDAGLLDFSPRLALPRSH